MQNHPTDTDITDDTDTPLRGWEILRRADTPVYVRAVEFVVEDERLNFYTDLKLVASFHSGECDVRLMQS